MNRNIFVAIVLLFLLLITIAGAQDVIYLPGIWSPESDVQSAAVIADSLLDDGDIVACTNRGILSFDRSGDRKSATTRCQLVPTKTPVPTLTAIHTLVPTMPPPPTNTTIPPTNVPPTNTGVPPTSAPPTNTPVSGARIEPFVGAPLCASHNGTEWHSLWDYKRGCHYDHTHNADPASANGVLGPVAASWGGQSISYPWLTGNGMEQTMKHNGYKYLVELNLPPVDLSLNWQPSGNNAITDIRVEHHRMGGLLDLLVRNHSFYQEVRICKGDRCGVMKFGGWNDYGILHSPYKKAILPLPGIDPSPVNQTIDEDPYRAAQPLAETKEIATRAFARSKGGGLVEDVNNDVVSLWTTQPGRYGFNRLGGTFNIVFDDWQGVDASNPSRVDLLCDPANSPCRFNSSEHGLFTAWAYVPFELDNDGDGFVSYIGFTDRMGNIVQGCAAPAMDCVPLLINNAPVGYAAWNVPTNNGKWLERWHDYDLSPANEWWIKYPN